MTVKDFEKTLSTPIEKFGVKWHLSAETCLDEEDSEYLTFRLGAEHTYENK